MQPAFSFVRRAGFCADHLCLTWQSPALRGDRGWSWCRSPGAHRAWRITTWPLKQIPWPVASAWQCRTV